MSVVYICLSVAYCYMAWREVAFYYACREEILARDPDADAPRLSTLGMLVTGLLWPYYRYVFWKLLKENDDG